jgi:hypothetical protein
MNLSKIALVALLLSGLTLGTPDVSASVITFEDIVIPNDPINPGLGHEFLNSGNYGFDWSGGAHDSSWVVSTANDHWFSGEQSHSGENFVWSNGGVDLKMLGNAFNLDGFWARVGYDSFSIVARGFNEGIEVFTKSLVLTDTYQQFTLDFYNIDNLTISNVDSVNILIDDISVSAVPEPSTTALLIPGLFIAGLISRKKTLNRIKL